MAQPSDPTWLNSTVGRGDFIAAPIPLTFSGDPATAEVSQWVPWPAGATSALVAWGNTATGAPVGVRKLYGSQHGGADGATTQVELLPAPADNPAGAASSCIVRGIAPINYIRASYTGTAAVHTDDSQVAGRPPTITFFFGG